MRGPGRETFLRWLVVAMTGVVWSVCRPAYAEVIVIYRTSDQAVVGFVYPPHSVEMEIENLTKSELGGTPDDYATVTVSDAQWTKKGAQSVKITPQGKAVFQANPKVKARKAARKAGRKKLRQLGLTDDELEALFGQ